MTKEIKRFLIAVLRFHGDVLLTTPIVNSIKRNYPNALIDVLVYEGTGVLLENDSRVENILEASISSELGFMKRILAELNLLNTLRKNKYDFGIFLTTQWRVALMGRVLNNVKTAAVDDKKRRTFLWTKSFSFIFPEAGNNHIIERNLRALEILGITPKEEDFMLNINIPDNSKVFVERSLDEFLVKDKFCVMHPVSRRKSKQWSQDSFAVLADHYSKLGLKVVLTSGPDKEEINYLKGICDLSKSVPINLGGKTSLYDLAALIERANFFVGLDSVASHLAAAVNTKGVVLFGPSKQENWKPWSDRIRVICRTKEEEYCKIHGHMEGKYKKCLCYISPERVIGEVDRLFN